jgi:hypothetical protein
VSRTGAGPSRSGGPDRASLPRSILALAAALAACKSKEPPPAAEPAKPAAAATPATPAAPAADWVARCEAALAGAPKLGPARRVEAIIDGCRPCGDWTPLLRWNVLAADGGPKAAEIEAAMDACRAYCKPEAKIAFLGTLEASRGKRSPRPWRELGEACREEVSAKADVRYMSAPYFALDRIARAAAAHPRLAPLLAAIELPLPPLSSTGGAFVLPPSPAIAPDAGRVHVTVSTTEITVGALPRATLGAAGVTVDSTGLRPAPRAEPAGSPPRDSLTRIDAGEALYPGATVAPRALAAALDRLAPDPDARIALIAPRAMSARRLLDVVKAAGAHKLVLAAAVAGAPEGWTLPGVVPVVLSAAPPDAGALRLELGESADGAVRAVKEAPAAALAAPPVIAVGGKATVEGLAKLLGALAYREVHAASLERARS